MPKKKGRWIKTRKIIDKYPKTEQQKKIEEAGKGIKEKCIGMKGQKFFICRSDVLNKIFKKKEDESIA